MVYKLAKMHIQSFFAFDTATFLAGAGRLVNLAETYQTYVLGVSIALEIT